MYQEIAVQEAKIRQGSHRADERFAIEEGLWVHAGAGLSPGILPAQKRTPAVCIAGGQRIREFLGEISTYIAANDRLTTRQRNCAVKSPKAPTFLG